MKKYSGVKRNCKAGNEQCGGTCINPQQKTCRLMDSQIKAVINRLIATSPRQLLKAAKAKGFGPVQYITQAEALRVMAVYGSGNSISDMKSGVASHPYLKINKIEQSLVDRYHDKLKADKLTAVQRGDKSLSLYDRLSKAGIRGNNPKISTEDKVKIFIRLYMEQNGQSFATGNPVNINRLVVDHVIPLTAGGKNSIGNMVLIESNINYWKKAIPTQDAMATALKNKLALSVPPDTLTKYAKAVSAGNKLESEKLKVEIQKVSKLQARNLDRLQAQQYKTGAANKGALLNSYSNTRWAKFNTVSSLDALNGKEIRQLLKAQSSEANTVRGWVRFSSAKEQVELPRTNVAKLQIFLTNGGKWADAPDAWKDDFKDTYLKNQHPKGNAAIKSQYGSLPDAPTWLK